MSIQAIIMDWRPAYLQSSRSAVSTLLAPLGTETVVQHLWAQLLKAEIQSSTVMPDFETDTAYQSALQAVLGDVRLCRNEGFLDFLESLEPADLLLTIDPRCYALDGYDFAGLLRGSNTCHLPRHLVQLQGNARGAQERVVYDSELRVRCVQRLYDGVTQVQAVGIGASLISAAVARHLDLSAGLSPAQIRRQLAAHDIPSTDLTVHGPTFDLSTEAGLLALNEQVVLGSTRRARRSAGRRSEEFSLWAGPGSSIDPHSRLYGPIVVHAGARIAPHAVVIGPAVLGPGAQVARGSLVCQCVFGPGARVSAGDCIVRRVLVGQAPAKAAAGHKPSAPASAQRSEPRLLRRRRRRAASRAPTGDKRWYPRLKRAGLRGWLAWWCWRPCWRQRCWSGRARAGRCCLDTSARPERPRISLLEVPHDDRPRSRPARIYVRTRWMGRSLNCPMTRVTPLGKLPPRISTNCRNCTTYCSAT